MAVTSIVPLELNIRNFNTHGEHLQISIRGVESFKCGIPAAIQHLHDKERKAEFASKALQKPSV